MRVVGDSCEVGDGRPICIIATLVSPVVFHQRIALDALLMAATSRLMGLPPAQVEPCTIEIPIERKGGIYLASWAIGETVARSTGHRQKPVPLRALIAYAKRNPKYNVVAGRGKPTRIPEERQLVRELRWHAMGDTDRVRDLLRIVSSVGARRGAGMGSVREWAVEEITPWQGFPVLAEDGAPLRSLPPSWPGVSGGRRALSRLVPPYWSGDRVEAVEPC